jgi:predicted DCC family thiol-disulfide oxidoreductase YuxK
MRPILLYDGHCNFCIQVTRFLERINKKKIRLIPFQSASEIISEYNFGEMDLRSKIHLISSNGQIYKGGEAIAEMSKFFPLIRLFLSFFKTNLGRQLYYLISRNRYKIFGCSNACYISKYS